MGKKKQQKREALREASANLVEEVFAGHWNDLAGLKDLPLIQNPVLQAELAKRCPGFLSIDYETALSNAVRDNR